MTDGQMVVVKHNLVIEKRLYYFILLAHLLIGMQIGILGMRYFAGKCV